MGEDVEGNDRGRIKGIFPGICLKGVRKNDIRCRQRIEQGPSRIRARSVRLELAFSVCQ